MRNIWGRLVFRALIATSIFVSAISAQTAGTGTLVGSITDATGAIVAAAKVQVVNVNTSFVSETTTSTEGAYYVPAGRGSPHIPHIRYS